MRSSSGITGTAKAPAAGVFVGGLSSGSKRASDWESGEGLGKIGCNGGEEYLSYVTLTGGCFSIILSLSPIF